MTLGSTVSLPVSSQAPSYPVRPIHIISPIPAGGSNDVLVRDVGRKLSERWGQPVVVENKAGAAGSIGTAAGAKAPADGYNLTLVYSSHSINPHLYSKLPFDAIKDFSPVVLMAALPMGLFVNSNSPAKTVAEFISMAKAKPNSVVYASAGNGSVSHLVGAMFATYTETKLVHAPYRGSIPAVNDLLGGQVPAMFADVDVVRQHVKSGALSALAVATKSRVRGYEDVPTFAEAGVKDLEVSSQVGLLAPAGTPPDIIQKLNRESVAILKDPEMTKRINDRGMDVVASRPEEFAKVIQEDLERFGKIIRASGMKVE